MWRTLIAAMVLMLAAGLAGAQTHGLIERWEVCTQGGGGVVTQCRPLVGRIDPQGRELWLRGTVRARSGDETGMSGLFISGAASSHSWFNGVEIGANGATGATAATERPGHYDVSYPLPDNLWRPAGNTLVIEMSSFHAGLKLDFPIGGIWIGPYPGRPRLALLAVTFAAAGALFAAAFGFVAVFVQRRSPSSLNLAALAAVGGTQAVVENLRSLVRYDYPVHVWRVGAIWILAALFAWLLVAYVAARFVPRRPGVLLAVAAVVIPGSYLLEGFDFKTAVALLAGVGLAGVAATVGVIGKRPQARPILAYLIAFFAVGVAAPNWLLDVSFFVLAASLTLPLLVLEVIRLGRDDRDREAALIRAAARPDRLPVATGKGVVLTPLNDIIAILGADDYAELRLTGARSLLHAARLERLETQLPPSFLRVHRSAIANLSHVERLERDGGRWRLEMAGGLCLNVSRARLPAVREAVESSTPVDRIAI